MNDSDYAIELENITKTFGSVVANRNINLNVKQGEILALLGENGAGKSTLLNAVAGVWPVDSGSILIDGEDVTGMPEYKRAKYIGRVFQDPMMGTAAGMMIEENLAIAARRGKTPGLKWGLDSDNQTWFSELLQELDLGLENRMTAKVGLLSGGQRQALTLLMATLIKPKLLLLDEHTAALDPKTAAKVLALTERIVNRDHLTTLMITHNMRDALRCGNRLIMLHNGRVIIDVEGEEKSRLTIPDLLKMFEQASGDMLDSDRLLLS